MKDRNILRSEHGGGAQRAAADWFVEIDADRVDEGASSELEAWLAADGQYEDALARCEAAMFLGKQIAASFETRRRQAVSMPDSRVLTWLKRPVVTWSKRPALTRLGSLALAWSIAGLSLFVSALVLVYRTPTTQIRQPEQAIAAQTRTGVDAAPLASYQIGLNLASPVSAVVLPGQINVDARSLAVLPFTALHGLSSADESTADENASDDPQGGAVLHSLYAALVRRFEAIPGLYVADPSAVAPYSRIEGNASDLAADLGVRAIVQGRVATAGPRIQVQLSLTDGVDGAVLWQRSFDRPFGELNGIENETVSSIAAALAAVGPSDEQTASTAAPIHY